MRFTTKVLLLQLATVLAVVFVATGVYTYFAVERLRAEAESSALLIARTVAAQPVVRAEVAAQSADGVLPDKASLIDGPLQQLATESALSSGALFVVITDSAGKRLSHPEAEKLGETVSTSFDETLRGEEVTAWETGTLGPSARAKVPVFAPGSDQPVGQVSVGFQPASAYDDLPLVLVIIAGGGVLALVVGGAAALLLRRWWENTTMGIQPEELSALVQTQAAVLDGVDDGVLAVDEAGMVQMANDRAVSVLGSDPVGMSVEKLGIPLKSVDGAVVGGHVLYIDVKPVRRGNRVLGSVVVLRDRTDLTALAGRLDSVRSMTSALRVQRHEFANAMHAAAGLIDAGRSDEAAGFLRDLQQHGPVDYPLEGIEHLEEPFLRSYLGAAALQAGERGVALRLSGDTLVLGELRVVEDVATVLGNLVGNAVTAAANAPEPRWVEVTLMDSGDELVTVVADSGTGLAPGVDFLAPVDRGADDSDRVHGHGIGLSLCRDLARRRGGELWLIDRGGNGTGAIVAARLPRVMQERQPQAGEQ